MVEVEEEPVAVAVVVVVLVPGDCYFYFVEGESVRSRVAEILELTRSLAHVFTTFHFKDMSEKESGI